MVRCNYCRKKSSVSLKCKYCQGEFCTICRLQETHKCSKIDEMKSTKQQILEQTLMLQKTEASKIVKI